MKLFQVVLFFVCVLDAVFAILKCDCNICEGNQNTTCITDGLCFTEVNQNKDEIHYTYSCLSQEQYLPPGEFPFICRSEKRYMGVECCSSHDYCNRDLVPPLPFPVECKWNNVVYREGDELPTRHLCLSCKCSKDFVEPSDAHCDVIQCPQIDYMGVGCLPTYNASECCPVSWDCEKAKSLKCDQRYTKHYTMKGCTPVYGEGSECPIRFQCPTTSDPEEVRRMNNSVCHYRGLGYQEGEDIPSNNPCDIACKCLQTGTGVNMKCAVNDCWLGVRPLSGDKCYYVYEKDQCCPVREECVSLEDTEKQSAVCVYDNRTYYPGEMIYSKEDPCLSCFCDENWTGMRGNSCSIHECTMLDSQRRLMQRGCVPIYHEGTCCPIEMFCANQGQDKVVELSMPELDTESVQTCVFNRVRYALGQVVDIKHPTHCVTCTCATPPDITCVHKMCSYREDCAGEYTPGQCCPTYNCSKADVASVIQCSPVQCPVGCSEVTIGNSCPFCQCEEKICAPPKCPSGCEAEKEVQQGKCPECQCPDSISSEIFCSPVNCTPDCYEVTNPPGCPSCECGLLCAVPICGPGCKIDKNTNEGCPSCVCSTSDDFGPRFAPSLPQKPPPVMCSPVQCPPGCSEVTIRNSCPFCRCEDLICSPPKCPPDCEVELDVTPGQCPGCKCPNTMQNKVLCSPVKCPSHCHEVKNPTGCPSCVCGPLCSPPKCGADCKLHRNDEDGCPSCQCPAGDDSSDANQECSVMECPSTCRKERGLSNCEKCICSPLCSPPSCEPGCRVDPTPSPNTCPGCICGDQQSSPVCSPVKCGPLCIEAFNGTGCPYCLCDPMCSPPNCEPGCALEFDPTQGPCPRCICTKATNEIACPNIKCGEKCLQMIGFDGCQKCRCGPLCSPPLCDADCHLEYDRTTGPCPFCVCTAPRDFSDVLCSPPKCDEGCKIDYSTQPCPSCSCNGDAHVGVPVPKLRCTPPRCKEGCKIDYSTKPCPSCNCDEDIGVPQVQCTPPRCSDGCRIEYSTKPCPSCNCTQRLDSSPVGSAAPVQCSPPKCDQGCRIDYSTQPCPSCTCSIEPTGSTAPVQCSPPKCARGCHIDYSTQPCPSCTCTNAHAPIGSAAPVQCSPPKCGLGCHINYSTQPCPSCNCNNKPIGSTAPVQCSPPNCGRGCRIDYSTQPCPSCNCTNASIGSASPVWCSPLNCGRGCHVDYSTQPCPSCTCTNAPISNTAPVQCSPPNCGQGCHIDYSTQPCPSCTCSNAPIIALPVIQCSPPKCDDPSCNIDYTTKPCPSCKCPGADRSSVQCPPVRCEPNCVEMVGRDGCSTCHCGPHCSMPQCGPGCQIDYSADPCPACVCDRFNRNSLHQPMVFLDSFCSKMKCGPGCERALIQNNERCPLCNCPGIGGSKLTCAPMHCELPCQFRRFTEHGCPTCLCHTLMQPF